MKSRNVGIVPLLVGAIITLGVLYIGARVISAGWKAGQ